MTIKQVGDSASRDEVLRKHVTTEQAGDCAIHDGVLTEFLEEVLEREQRPTQQPGHDEPMDGEEEPRRREATDRNRARKHISLEEGEATHRSGGASTSSLTTPGARPRPLRLQEMARAHRLPALPQRASSNPRRGEPALLPHGVLPKLWPQVLRFRLRQPPVATPCASRLRPLQSRLRRRRRRALMPSQLLRVARGV